MQQELNALRQSLDDPDFKAKAYDLAAIGNLLSRCIVRNAYRVRPSMVERIKLSELGESFQHDLLLAKRRLKSPDVRLGLFLQLGCPLGLLFDPTDCDVDAVMEEVTREIDEGRILYPYIYGRELHDVIARVRPNSTEFDNNETVRMLSESPVGAFQIGRVTVGAFGCIRSAAYREIRPTTNIPAYYCSDEACRVRHPFRFRTGSTAISRTREEIRDYLLIQTAGIPDDFSRVFREALAGLYDPLDRTSSGALIDTIADSFSNGELVALVTELLRRRLKLDGSAAFSAVIRREVRDPSVFAATLTRPEMVHLLLLFEDSAISAATDLCVSAGRIDLQQYELRTHRMLRGGGGQDSLAIGSLGVRPLSQSVAPRLFSLLNHVYIESGALTLADLRFGLEIPASVPDSGLIDDTVARYSPREIVDRSILNHRLAAKAAGTHLHIATPVEEVGRDRLRDAMLWKLGEPTAYKFSELGLADQLVHKLLREDMSESLPPKAKLNELFVEIENCLQRSLFFTTWALSEDHYRSDDGFVYDPGLGSHALDLLGELNPSDNSDIALSGDGRNSLGALAAGFGRLRRGLSTLKSEEHVRPTDQLPLISRIAAKPFAFDSTVPYLNVTLASQAQLQEALLQLATIFGSQSLLDLRNASAHGNRTLPPAADIKKTLSEIVVGVDLLRTSGLFPAIFTFESRASDEYGRVMLRYKSGFSTIELAQHTWTEVRRMPLNQQRLVIFPMATLPSNGALRFSIKDRPGIEAYWQGWSRRVSSAGSFGSGIGEPAEEQGEGAAVAS